MGQDYTYDKWFLPVPMPAFLFIHHSDYARERNEKQLF